MIELINTYSLKEIIIFVIMLIFALQGFEKTVEWAKDVYKRQFKKDYNKLTEKELFKKHLEESQEQYEGILYLYSEIDDKLDTLSRRMDTMENSIERLTESDMHDIKSWIVEKHHFLMKQGWVDDFTMDLLEKRYQDYIAEGGNSYIENLMRDLRKLDHYLPEDED